GSSRPRGRAAAACPTRFRSDYGIKKGLELRDEITRYWRIAEALWSEFAAARSQPGHDPHAVARSFARQLLADAFDFEDLRDGGRSEEHASELQSRAKLVCRL